MAEYISLKIKEFIYTEASNDFFWGITLFCVLMSGFAWYLKNFFYIPVLIVGGILIMVFAKQEPHEIDLLINEEGFIYKSRNISWSTFKTFWFDLDTEGNLRLLLQKKSHRFDEFEVFHFIEDFDIDILRELLLSYEMTEEPLEESLFQQILERFGY